MANYIPIGAGYTPIGGQAFRSPKKKFPHLKGEERRMALLDQQMNPRQAGPQGYGGLADMYAGDAIDKVTNLPAVMTDFDLANVRNNLAKAGELEALNLFNNYQQKLPGSAEALMEFRNMRQAQQQFAQRPAAPTNPYTPPTQNKPLYVPTGQPQPPANVPQIAGDAATSIGNMLSSAMPKPRPSGSGVNIDPSLWTPEAMARSNPYGANARPLPTNPNDMRGQARGYGLVYSSGGGSNIAPAGGKVAGWSPTYSGDRQVAPQGSSLPQNPYQAAPTQPAPFDMQAAVARNRAALDAKYPTDNIKPMNRLERQALAGPSPVAIPYGRDRPVIGRTMTDPATQLTPTPSWRDDYLKQNPTPYAVPQGVDLDLPNYSNKNQKMYSQPLLNAANAAGSAAGRYADDQAGRATGVDLWRETMTDPMQLRSQAGAAGVSGKLGAFENEYDKWLKYQGGVDKQFDAQSARRKLMIDNLARNPYIR